MYPLLHGIVIFFVKCSHSRTESSFLFLIQKSHHSLTKSSLFCQTATTLVRNRRFCFLAWSKNAPQAGPPFLVKMCPLLHGIVIFLLKLYHSRTESSFLLPIKKMHHSLTKSSLFCETAKNVRASRVFIFRTVKNVRASRVFMFEIVVLQCFPDISVAKT